MNRQLMHTRWQQHTTAVLLLLCLCFPRFAFAFSPYDILSDQQFADASSMNEHDIQTFLENQGSGLAHLNLTPDGALPSHVIAQAAVDHHINPKVLLVLLQKEQSLVTDATPSAKQIQWATGFGVCDSCSLSDPGVQKYRGFQTQVNSAASLLRSLVDNPLLSRIRQGIAALIDHTTVIPNSNATAALYTYTPHLHGNLVFWGLWNRWFEQEYPDGTLLKSPTNNQVWYIRYGERRPINSMSVLRSRFGTQPIITVSSQSEIEKYPLGPGVALQNFSLVRTPDGHISLIDGDEFHPILSMEIFRQLGFNPDEVDDITSDTLSGYTAGAPLNNSSAYPTGALLQDRSTGGIYYVRDTVKHPVMDRILLKQFRMHLVVTTADELNQFSLGDPVVFPDGTLIKSKNQKAVYLISQGKRKPIASGSVFTALGFSQKNILTVSDAVIALHPLGETIDAATSDIPNSDIRPQFR